MFEVVEMPALRHLTIEASAQCTPKCRLGDAPFEATVYVTYVPRTNCIEFVSFEEWIESLGEQSTTVEELCLTIFSALGRKLQPEQLTVKVEAMTDVHRPVTVRRSETFLGREFDE